jgi:V/A-type H+/Na+-transporting ATPase subunit G/H
MGKAETLQKIKEAEAQIRTTKAAAEQERERALRETRREALELIESFRNQAEDRYRQVVSAAAEAVAKERERLLAAARDDAARMTAAGQTQVDKAVDLVLAKFRGALRV